MFKRRRRAKLSTQTRYADNTRRRIARKSTIKKLTKRRINQTSIRFEEIQADCAA